MALLWKVPGHQADELIPSRCLSPVRSPEVAVVQTPFPPDDRSYGWERGTTVSQEWVAATTDAALDVAGYVVGPPAGTGGRGGRRRRTATPKLRAFCRSFAERAFRRPLTDAEKQQLVDRQFEGGADPDLAVKRVVIRVMISPEFLYPGALDGSGRPRREYAVGVAAGAGAVGFAAGSGAARRRGGGQAVDARGDRRQAERMLDDPRARRRSASSCWRGCGSISRRSW